MKKLLFILLILTFSFDYIKSNQEIINKPCEEIQNFVIEIEKMKWVSDIERAKKVTYSELTSNKIFYFNKRPFYQVNFTETKTSKLDNKNSPHYHRNINFEVLKKVKNIWFYFYRGEKKDDIISDGIIEQWEFEVETEAIDALNEMKKNGEFIYFNTTPYFCRIKNKLVIFQTRAMMFSFHQESVFKKFLLEKSVTTN